MQTEKMINEFNSIYGEHEDPRVFFAPGRINLVGEHTDYNGGHVFPAAISFGTYAITQRRNDDTIQFNDYPTSSE